MPVELAIIPSITVTGSRYAMNGARASLDPTRRSPRKGITD